MPATYCRTSSAWKPLRGNTTANNLRTCETVSAGAFFFQSALEMPQKEMGEHTREHMMVPPRVCAHFVVVHPEFSFRFLKTLFNGPPDPTEPHKETQGRTPRRVTEIIPVPRMRAERPLDDQPHRRRGLPLLAQYEPFAGELVRDRAFGPLRHCPAIPKCRGYCVGHLGHRARWGVSHGDALGALCSFIGRRVPGGRERLEPPPRVRRRRHERHGTHTGLKSGPKVWTVAIEAVRHNILERQHTGPVEPLHHRCRQLGFALRRDLVRQLTFRPPGLVGIGEPWLRQEEPFVDEGVALPRGIGGK